MRKKLVSLLGILILVAAVTIPAVGATTDTTEQITEKGIYYQTGTSWSGTNDYTIVSTVYPTAGGATPSVTTTIPWDELASADILVTYLKSGIETNTGDTKKFIEAMGSVFYGKGSYHEFSDPTGNGYDKYWVSPSDMYGHGGKTGKTITVKYSLTLYAESKVEAEEKIKAGFEALGLEAEVSVVASQTVGTKVEYTVEVTTTLYQHYYTTWYEGSIWRHYHVNSNSNFIPTSFPNNKNMAFSMGGTYDIQDHKDFSFSKHFTFYSYDDVDLSSLGAYGTLTS
ncbi:hypothetical protein [Thermococcus sp. Bubb.Bath]|uniref:hypothetical protein n=1 Tax=Thermococcus sp. Bubb.Bath TaxID=1638242 RepID=UPI001439C1A3|nr:hypothetical protein [Thermococcus sp. Bubb.Bath]NJF24480.1 hypothetical protein [Thermococcus sp. Bubb.Bath]